MWLDNYMTNNTTGRREYASAIKSLADAEQLHDILREAACVNADNDYLADALRHAEELYAEMNANLDDVMDRYSPDECGL